MKILFVIVCFLLSSLPVDAQKFLLDDPIWVDDDQLNIPMPAKADISQLYDFLENSFGEPAGDAIERAQNINTLGEVPDSSWFTNRIGRREMTVEEMVRGPNRG